MSGAVPERGGWRLHAGSPAAILLSLAAAAVLVQSAVSAAHNLVSPAWHDLWDWVPMYQRWLDGSYRWGDFLTPYYEHRIVLTKVLLLADSAWDWMDGRLVQVVALLLLAGFGWLVWRITRLDAPAAPVWLPPLFWVALLSSLAQYENIDLPFQVQFPVAVFAAGSACLLLARATMATGVRAAWLAGAAGAAGIVAAFSLGSGVLLAPSLWVMLILRRARPAVWGVFVPLSVLGLVLFFQGHDRISQPGLPLLDWHLTVMRVVYSCNFVAAALGAYPAVATWAGAAGLVLFAALCVGLARRFWLAGRAVPPADAALLALGLMVVLCAPAGTLTARLLFGPAAALASRYATMSLVFAAAMLGLAACWAGRTAPGWVRRVGVPACALVLLGAVNGPTYVSHAAGLHRVVLADTQLLVNDVGAEGRTPTIFLGGVDTVRDDIAVLHAQKLNMFAPGNGPPAGLLARLGRTDTATLPACRGQVDAAYAIDGAAVLATGWVADPAGHETAPWVLALDQAGQVAGSARQLEDRPDVRAALGVAGDAHGFAAGLRLPDAVRTGTLHLLGLFPGAAAPVCSLLAPGVVGPLPIEPVSRLVGSLAPAPARAAPEIDGMVPWRGVALAGSGPVPSAAAGAQAWGFLALGRADASASVVFHLTPAAPPGLALAVPFFTSAWEPAQRITVVMGDGTRLATALPVPWQQPGWRAVVVPPALLAAHGGVATVEAVARGQAWLAVGTPLLAGVQPDWSRLF